MSEQLTQQQIRDQISALVAQFGARASAPKAFEPGVTVIPPAGKVVGAPEMELMVEASLDAFADAPDLGAVASKMLYQDRVTLNSAGDLLTTADTPGHAMRATDQHRAFGAVLGKAMAPLASGRGQIPILVSLQ